MFDQGPRLRKRMPSSRTRMMLAIRLVLITLIALITGGGAQGLAAQSAPSDEVDEEPAWMAGRVVEANTGRPISQALVVLPALGIGTRTDSAGLFAFQGLEPGVESIEVRYLGRRSPETEVKLSAGQITRVDLSVAVNTIEVPELKVTVENEQIGNSKLLGFYRRKNSLPGRFITRKEIEEHQGQQFSAVFRGVNGFRLVPCGSVGCYRLVTSRGTPSFQTPKASGGGCQPVYYLDGIRWRLGPQGLNDLSLQEVAAVEVYSGPATQPAKFRSSNSTCGVVAIWTRSIGEEG